PAAGLLDHPDQRVEHLHARGQGPFHLAGELGRGAVAVGHARVAGEHGEVAGLRPGGRYPQVRGRVVGHVVRRVRRWPAVLADVGAQDGEVARVARPHEVVDLVAVVADAARRRVHQAQVAQFQLADAVEVAAGVHAGDAAADARLALAFGDDALARRLDRFLVGASATAA